MSEPLVVAVILNTNRRQDTLECLASLAQSSYRRLRTIVLDNASTDGSVAAIESAFPDVTVLSLQDNRGYAGNNNVGIQAAMNVGADWVFVLNEDTVLASDCIETLVHGGESDPRIGMVGPLVYHHNEPTVIQSAGGVLNARWQSSHLAMNEVDEGQYQTPHPVSWLNGCALLVRRKLIEQVGMLDERFFYYWEETDWCLRAHNEGWRIVHVPEAKLWHKGVQRDYRPSPSVAYYNTRNRLLFLSKHRASLWSWALVTIELTRTLASLSLRPKWRAMHAHRDAMWQGLLDFTRGQWGMRRI
jgi:GT2 family glycosyltransferase